MMSYKAGMFVRHPSKPEWGLGKVLAASGNEVHVFFTNDAKEDYRTFRTDKIALDIQPPQIHPVLDNLPPFKDGRFSVKSNKVSFDDVVATFSQRFPLGFEDPGYLGRDNLDYGEPGERNYKLAVHQRYVEMLGNGLGEKLLEQDKVAELNKLVADLLRLKDINLLSLYETMAINDGLNADESLTKQFYTALFEFISAPAPDEQRFTDLVNGLSNLPVAKDASRVETWPNLTILPFLADPQRFMFLKPEPTKECAARLRFDIQYSPELRWITYRKLLEMSDMLLERLRPLGARDYIDVQSFIWIIAKY